METSVKLSLAESLLRVFGFNRLLVNALINDKSLSGCPIRAYVTALFRCRDLNYGV